MVATPANNLLPASATTKAAAYEIMRRVSETAQPPEGVRRFLTLLSAQPWLSSTIEAGVARLIQEYGARAHAALIKWNFSGVRKELISLLERVREIEPSICERLMAELKPADDEIAMAERRNESKNRKQR